MDRHPLAIPLRSGRLPSLQELRDSRAEWIIPREVTFADAVCGRLVDDCLAISHRWDDASHPDPGMEQMRTLQRHLREHPRGRRAKFVWYDYMWCGAAVRSYGRLHAVSCVESVLPAVQL